MSGPGTLLATGFVVDAPADGTIFPSAGGNSGNPKVQAVYWRCIATLFASARITNPGQRLALFSNVTPPVLDGVDLAALLASWQVELRRVPLTARLPAGRTQSWGNVLYFFDIMDALTQEDPELRFALVDSDVLVTRDLAPLWRLLDRTDFAGYIEDTPIDDDINGLTRRNMTEIASGLGGVPPAPIPHFGGELFACRMAGWQRHREAFRDVFDQAERGSGPAAGVLTEEHIFSIVFALLQDRPADAHGVIRRIWTSPRYSNVRRSDVDLTLWHLPAEKRYGLRDLFALLARRDFALDLAPAQFRARAAALCGIPAKSPSKIVRDGMRQVAAKLGLRT